MVEMKTTLRKTNQHKLSVRSGSSILEGFDYVKLLHLSSHLQALHIDSSETAPGARGSQRSKTLKTIIQTRHDGLAMYSMSSSFTALDDLNMLHTGPSPLVSVTHTNERI